MSLNKMIYFVIMSKKSKSKFIIPFRSYDATNIHIDARDKLIISFFMVRG